MVPLVLKNLVTLAMGTTGYVNHHLACTNEEEHLGTFMGNRGRNLDRTSRNKIRDYGVDVNQYVCSNWQIESNQFYPISKNFGETIGLNQVDKLESIFKDRRKKLLCVNDDGDFKGRKHHSFQANFK